MAAKEALRSTIIIKKILELNVKSVIDKQSVIMKSVIDKQSVIMKSVIDKQSVIMKSVIDKQSVIMKSVIDKQSVIMKSVIDKQSVIMLIKNREFLMRKANGCEILLRLGMRDFGIIYALVEF